MTLAFRLALLWWWLWLVPAAAHFYYGRDELRVADVVAGLAMTAILVGATISIRARAWRHAVVLFGAIGAMLGGLVEIGAQATTEADVDSEIVAAIFDTTFGEATEMFGSRLAGDATVFAAFLVIPAAAFLIAVLRSGDAGRSSRRLTRLVCAVVLLGAVPGRAIVVLALNGREEKRTILERVNPVESYDDFRALYSIGSGVVRSVKERWAPIADVGAVTTSGSQPDALIVIVGESLSRHHMGLYGYARQTTPRLSAMASRLMVFSDVIATRLYTSASLNDAFSIGFERPAPPRAPTIFQALGASFETAWVSNVTPLGLGESSEARLAKTVPTRVWVSPSLVWA